MGMFDKFFGKKPDITREDTRLETEQETIQEDWEQQGTPQELQAHEVQRMLATDKPPVLVDVRETGELRSDGWIPGSLHIPMSEFLVRYSEIPRDKPIVVYCAVGMRSFDAGFYLIEHGYKDVANLNGGIRAWGGDLSRE